MNSELWNKLKNYFLAGFIALLPLWISFLILTAILRLTASVARPIIKTIPVVSAHPLLLDVVSFIGTVLILMFVGVVLTNVVGRRLFLMIEKNIKRIPLLSWIYVAIRKLTALFYAEDGQTRFRRVVMIEYPRKGIFVLGFLTTDALEDFNLKSNRSLVNVFLPTTPNPTSGFLLMLPKEDVTALEISVEDAVKLIVSAGVTEPGEG